MRLTDADELLEKAEYISTGFKSRGMQVCFHGVTAATIENAPTIDPESLRPRSYWEDVYQTGPCSFSGRCHACGVRNDIPPVEQAYYCPHCGAKMED